MPLPPQGNSPTPSRRPPGARSSTPSVVSPTTRPPGIRGSTASTVRPPRLGQQTASSPTATSSPTGTVPGDRALRLPVRWSSSPSPSRHRGAAVAAEMAAAIRRPPGSPPPSIPGRSPSPQTTAKKPMMSAGRRRSGRWTQPESGIPSTTPITSSTDRSLSTPSREERTKEQRAGCTR